MHSEKFGSIQHRSKTGICLNFRIPCQILYHHYSGALKKHPSIVFIHLGNLCSNCTTFSSIKMLGTNFCHLITFKDKGNVQMMSVLRGRELANFWQKEGRLRDLCTVDSDRGGVKIKKKLTDVICTCPLKRVAHIDLLRFGYSINLLCLE